PHRAHSTSEASRRLKGSWTGWRSGTAAARKVCHERGGRGKGRFVPPRRLVEVLHQLRFDFPREVPQRFGQRNSDTATFIFRIAQEERNSTAFHSVARSIGKRTMIHVASWVTLSEAVRIAAEWREKEGRGAD